MKEIQTVMLAPRCTQAVKSLAKVFHVEQYIEEETAARKLLKAPDAHQKNSVVNSSPLTERLPSLSALLTYEPDFGVTEAEDEPEVILDDANEEEDQISFDPLAGTIIGENQSANRVEGIETGKSSERNVDSVKSPEASSSDSLPIKETTPNGLLKSILMRKPEGVEKVSEPGLVTPEMFAKMTESLKKKSHFYVVMDDDNKRLETLFCLGLDEEKSFIFCNSCDKSEWLASELRKKNLKPHLIVSFLLFTV